MQARYQATLQPEQRKGHKAACRGPRQVVFRGRSYQPALSGFSDDLRGKFPVQFLAALSRFQEFLARPGPDIVAKLLGLEHLKRTQ